MAERTLGKKSMRRLFLLLLLLSAATASAAVTGTVVADDGAPLAGARVRAFAREPFSATAARLLSSSPDPVPIATAESAADGRFSIDVKGNATIDIVVDAAGREPAALYAADGDDAGAISLSAASKARRVRVVADGKPVANALLYLGHSLLVRSDAQGNVVRTTTGEAGFIVHPDYGVGIIVERNGEVQLRRGTALRGRVVARDGTTPVAGATIVAGGWPMARSGDDGSFTIAHAPLRLHALVAVSGNDAGGAAVDGAKPTQIRLGTAASLSGTVTGKGQTPVAGATVSVSSEGQFDSAVTDAKGRYAMPALPAETYAAQAIHPGYVNARVAEVRAAPAATRAFALQPRSSVRGVVLNEDNKPAAGAFVAGGRFGISPIAMTTPAGEFTVRLADTGRVFVEAWKSGYAVAFSPSFTLQPGETKSGVTLTLQRGFPLRVKVVDRDKAPVANAAVDVSLAAAADGSDIVPVPCSVVDRVKCRLTGADGVMETRLGEGKYSVRVVGADFIAKVLPEQALTARSSPLVVTVERGAEVSGRVVFADGTPVADARVGPLNRGSVVFSDVVSDANGAFTLKQLPRTPETFVATVTDDSPLRSAPVKVTPPAHDVTLTIPTPSRLEGRVIDRVTSQPIASFTVTALRREASGPSRAVDVNDPNGVFVLKRVQPGALELRVTAPGYVGATVSDLLVEEGRALTGVEVKLDLGARVTGHVTAGGSAAAGVHVRTGTRRRNTASATTDANGDYTLDGVSLGDDTIDFMKEGFVTKHKSVQIVAGKDNRIDVDLDRGREIRGRVVDKSGQPVANARIGARTSAVPVMANGTSDSDGQFTISGLEDGRYTVSAQKNGYVSASADDVDAAAGRPVTLTMDRGGSIAGRVLGLPPEDLPQVRVSASGRSSTASDRVDANGNFTLTGIPDGTITVTAFKQGMPMRQSAPKVIEVVNGNAPPVDIDFGAGITVRGRVTRNGIAVSGGNVSFAPRGRGGVRAANGMIAPDGEYEVSGVEPGDYDVRVFAGGGGNDAVQYTVVGNAVFDIDLKGASARGVVLDAATGVPLPDVRVFVTPSSTQGGRVWRNASTDSDGRFTIDTLPDGSYTLRTEREHYAAASQTVTVSGGSTPPIEVRLARGQEAVVRLVDAETGASLDGGVALIDPQTKKYIGSSGMGRAEDGAIHVWAAPGRYTASIHVNGYLTQNVDVTVPGAEVRVAMTRGATLVITSRSGGRFRLIPPGVPPPSGVGGGVVGGTSGISVGPGQRMPFNSLMPGVYEVDRFSVDGKTLLQKYSVVLTAGQTANLDVE
jgi:5-hydroxyisourate hydrolase-like protein (transthyretin family)